MRYIVRKMRRFCGYLAGFVFYVSGILKLLDPVGAGLVMDEYLDFLHLGFLDFASKTAGVLFALAETLIGAALITGVWRKVTALAALVMQGFFTLLTLVLVIFNPEMDCGCFGEAVHLTHLQTFLKNIFLMLLLVGDFVPLKELGTPRKVKYGSFVLVAMSTVAFTVYSWMYIPLVDFTDYKATARLQAADDGLTQEDIYEAVFVYEKDGRQETFDLSHLPDSTWTYVSTQTRVKDDYKDQALTLSIFDSQGEYHDALTAQGKVMVISVYDPDISETKWTSIAKFAMDAQEAGFHPLILVADMGESIDDIVSELPEEMRAQLASDVYFSDYKTLVTLNRSNGGVTYFSDGYLIRKWARIAVPDSEELKVLESEAETETMIGRSTRGSLVLQSFLLYVFAVMLLF